MRAGFLEALGGEAGCERLSREFYARVAKEPVLRPLFPGKSLRCATEEFAAFLIQFLGGDEDQTQHRWWLSLRESHARFRIDPAQRSAWLKHMQATLDAAPLDGGTRTALRQLFLHSSAYIVGKEAAEPQHEELAARWGELPRREQEILLMRLHGGMTQAQIGQQLRISQMHVPGCSPARSATSARACPACRSAHPAPVSPRHPAWI